MERRSRHSYFESIVSGRNESVAALLLKFFLIVLSYPYMLFIRLRNFFYDKGVFKSFKVNCPVISVGNITLGGTGKTPFVEWLCRYLSGRGRKPVIISRGYGARTGESADEFKVLLSNLPSAKHIANPDRVQAAQKALSELKADCLILDDAFSHRRLERDFDILLLDVFAPFGYGCIFPGGFLREPIESAARADMLILTRADLVDEEYLADFEDKLKRFFPGKPIVRAIHNPVKIREIYSGKEFAPEWLSGKKVYAFCGIGNPAAFEETLKKLGADVVKLHAFDDHYNYKEEDVRRIISKSRESNAEIILTTQKDAVKINQLKYDAKICEILIRMELVIGTGEVEKRVDWFFD